MPILLDYKQLEKLEKRRRIPRRVRVSKSPARPERILRKQLEALWARVLLPATERLQQYAQEGAGPQVIADYLDQVLRQAEFEYGLAADDFLTTWKVSMDRQTRTALLRGLNESLGVDLTALYDDPVIQDVLAVSGLDAANLITTIPGEYLGQVARAVRDNFIGVPLPEGRSLTAQIQHLGDVSYGRAKLIARDQTKKLNSNLNQARQQSIGITVYIWKTVKDERVVGKPGGLYPQGNKAHGNHYMMEGLYCRWDDSLVYSEDKGKTWKKRRAEMPQTHPGQDIQCRCHAAPVIDIDQILKYAEAA